MALENLSVEQLENALKHRRAEERMGELVRTLDTFKSEVSGAVGLEDTYKVCARFVARVNHSRKNLGTSTPKQSAKPKKA